MKLLYNLTSINCIFCEQPSNPSKSVEHIIPESLGNKSHTLPPGVVCDGYNNYFSRKVERKVLEADYFKTLRLSQGIPSKKKNIPSQKATILPNVEVELIKERDGSNTVIVPPGKWDVLASQKKGQMVFPVSCFRRKTRATSNEQIFGKNCS